MSRQAEFFRAIESGDAARAKELLASEPELLRARDQNGATALHLAAEGGHRDLVRMLSDSGADINARDDRFGATPTGWAIEYLRGLGGLLGVEIEDALFAIREKDVRWLRRLLLRWPALATANDRAGKALATHARESGHAEIASLFETV